MSGRRSKLRLSALLIVFSIVQLSGEAAAQDGGDSVPEKPTLTVRITPPKPYLQEEIVQVVRVIAPHPFEELVLDLQPVHEAEVITLQQPKTRKFETYGGEGYIFETSRAIFPKQSGSLRIPPVRVSGSIGISRNEKEPFALRSEATSIDVRPPPQSFSDDWWLVARDVAIDEGWSLPLTELRVGDHVTRSITVTVAGATGEHLPELEQGRSNGITILSGRTKRSTDITPAGVIGKISRSFDIRVDSDQPVNISPIRVVWWNTSTEIERRTAAPAVRLEPLPRDVEKLVIDLMEEAAEARSSSRLGVIAIAGGGGAFALALAFWFLRAMRDRRSADRRLEQTLRDIDGPIDVVRALTSWANSVFPDEPSTSLEKLGDRLGPAARQRIDRLQEAAFGEAASSVDVTENAREIVRIARNRRARPVSKVFSDLTDRLLGPERRLPSTDLGFLRQRR